MNDTIIMENYLLVLKSNVEVFVHGTLESSFDDIQSLLKECLANTINCQRKTYNIMVENGMYTVQKIGVFPIKECLSNLKTN